MWWLPRFDVSVPLEALLHLLHLLLRGRRLLQLVLHLFVSFIVCLSLRPLLSRHQLEATHRNHNEIF